MKVKLPKEVAEAIEEIRKIAKRPNELVIKIATQSELYVGDAKYCDEIKDFSEENFNTLLQALVNGYEVEMTPEDKVRELYREYSAPYSGIGTQAIIRVLNALNIKISGVNAE